MAMVTAIETKCWHFESETLSIQQAIVQLLEGLQSLTRTFEHSTEEIDVGLNISQNHRCSVASWLMKGVTSGVPDPKVRITCCCGKIFV